jgi:O-antigen ligase
MQSEKYPVAVRNSALTKWVSNLVLVLLAGSTLLVLPYSVTDPINLPKMFVLVIVSGALLGLLVSSNKYSLQKSRRFFFILNLSFVLALLVQFFITSGIKSETFYGIPGRNTGILTYLSFAIVAYASFLVAEVFIIKRVLLLTVCLGFILAVYGIFQNFGKEPFPYLNVYESNVFGTFGNPNFQSAFLGIVSALAFSGLFVSGMSLYYKFLCTGLLALCLSGIYQTNSIQGFFNFLIGSTFFVLLLTYSKKLLKTSIAIALLLIFGLANVILSFMQIGPLANLIYKGSMSARVYYWDTAFRIWSDHPFTGVGLDQYGDWLRFYRTIEEVQRNITADSSHSVYLDVLSGGGVLLFLPFVFFTLFALLAIVRVMRRETPPPIEFLILVGLWTAHQAQSLISIGHIGVAVWGWVFTGLIIGYELNTRAAHMNIEDRKGRSPRKPDDNQKVSPQATLGIFVGLICGLAFALPPMISSSKYYNSFKTSDARVIKTATYLQPYNRNNFIQVASLLKANKFDGDSIEVALEGLKHFPNSYSLWRLLRDITPVGSKEHVESISRLRELDPNNSEFFPK